MTRSEAFDIICEDGLAPFHTNMGDETVVYSYIVRDYVVVVSVDRRSTVWTVTDFAHVNEAF